MRLWQLPWSLRAPPFCPALSGHCAWLTSNDSCCLTTGVLQRSGFLTLSLGPPWIIWGGNTREEGPLLTLALLWLTKPSAIFKQIPKPAPCVITAFTHAATFDKGDESVARFLGNAVHEFCFTDACLPNKTVSAGILEAHTRLDFPISE